MEYVITALLVVLIALMVGVPIYVRKQRQEDKEDKNYINNPPSSGGGGGEDHDGDYPRPVDEFDTDKK